MITRRQFFAASSALALAACVQPEDTLPPPGPELPPPPPPPPLPIFYGAVLDEPYPIAAVPEGVVDPKFWRQEVENPYPALEPGTTVVDPDATFLHLIQTGGRALRYGVSVGRQGFSWNGEAVLQYRQKWPHWRVSDEMVARQPELAPHSWRNGGMKPGPGNPLGARALYLFQNGEDTLYRIHGGCEPELLGKSVSSGCIRMLDQDAIDLHDRVRDRSKVVVLPSMRADSLSGTAVY